MTNTQVQRIVTPQEAQKRREATDRLLHSIAVHGGDTEAEEWLAAEVVAERARVATEAERIAAAERAAVVKALRGFGLKYAAGWALVEADAIENGAPL